VWGKTTPVEKDVHDHHRDKFAGFPENHGGVGDVRECGKSEGGSGDDECGALKVSQ